MGLGFSGGVDLSGYLPLTGGTMTGSIIGPNGTAANPALSVGAEKHGLYRQTSTALGIAVGGFHQVTIGGGYISANSYIQAGTYFKCAATSYVEWSGRTKAYSPAEGKVAIVDNTSGKGAGFDVVAYGGDYHGGVRLFYYSAGDAGGGFLVLDEVTAPSAPYTQAALLFARDDGSGKTELCARFPTGAIQVLAAEP